MLSCAPTYLFPIHHNFFRVSENYFIYSYVYHQGNIFESITKQLLTQNIFKTILKTFISPIFGPRLTWYRRQSNSTPKKNKSMQLLQFRSYIAEKNQKGYGKHYRLIKT
jgi:hypothetical protein